jgi:hypothetical protein
MSTAAAGFSASARQMADPVQAAMDGVRGPPLPLATMGASAYRAEVQRPGGTHARSQFFQMDRAPVQVDGRGKATWLPQRERPVRLDAADRSTDLKQVLQSAEHAINATQPVVHHDLHELAAKKTQELLERDKLVGSAVLAAGVTLAVIRVRPACASASAGWPHMHAHVAAPLDPRRWSCYMYRPSA